MAAVEGIKRGSPGPVFSGEEFYLERERINGLLENSLRCFATAIIAGEGYGKTYAAVSFLRRRPEQIIWVQLSDLDNNPWHVWENITKAASYRSQEIKKFFEETGFPGTPQEIYRYLSEIEKLSAGTKYIVVFDDLHLIHARPVLEFLERVLASPISNQKFMLLSRKEPELNTVPLLSKGRLSLIGAEELRFTKEESAEFFRIRGVEISAEDLEDIYRDTEGWALAVNFLADGLKKKDARYTRQLLNTGMIRAMMDRTYSRMNAPLQKFLIKVSLLEQWPREVLEKIAQDVEIITEMEHCTSLIRYDTYLHGYHIHRIVLDYLRERQGELSGGDIQEVSTLAAEWCLANDLPMDAALNYARARNYRKLSSIVFELRPIIPQRMAAFFLDLVERLIKSETRNEEDEDFLFLRYVIRPRLIMTLRRLEEAAAECRSAIALFESLPPSPLSSHILTGCYINMGNFAIVTARFSGVHAEADYFIRANYYYMRHPWSFKNLATRTNISSYVSQVAYPAKPGEIEEAIKSFARAAPHAANCFNGYLYGIDDLAWTELAYFRDELGSAEQHARRAVFKAREKKQYEAENRALFYLLRIALHSGDPRNVKIIWEQLESQLQIEDYLNRGIIHEIVSGWFYAHIREAGKVSPWIQNTFEENGINYMINSIETLVKIKYLYVVERYKDIFDILGREKGKLGARSFLLGMIELGCLEAITRRRMGDLPGAISCLERAWEAAAPNSLTMPFIELGDDMRLLISDAINRGGCAIPQDWLESTRRRASAYGKKLARAAGPYRQNNETQEGEEAEKTPVFLTRRETKVLTLLSQGFNRGEIAKETNSSVNNVKNSIRDIYRKFGAINRADAIRIATKQGLLP
jgi:LuxR family maltose regulon positive regulatory protein